MRSNSVVCNARLHTMLGLGQISTGAIHMNSLNIEGANIEKLCSVRNVTIQKVITIQWLI